MLREVSDILEEVYKDPVSLHEVNAAILSGYYADETVLLRDLLYPESSPVYQSAGFKERKPRPGSFRSQFIRQFNQQEYKSLRKALGGSLNQFLLSDLTAPSPTVPDTAMEIFSNSAGVSIYFPYSENFGSSFTPAWFDMINDPEWGPLATIVTADREADTGPGQEPYRVFVNGTGQIRYRNVTVSDAYAEVKMTHIVGIGAEPDMTQDPPPPAPPPRVNRVYLGELKCNYNHDKLISSYGRGGGNDVIIMRISGYLQPVNSQVTNYAGDLIRMKFKRRDPRNQVYRRSYQVWDPDWISENNEQVFVVYEDDDNITKTITGSLSTTLSLGPATNNNSATGSINYSVTIPNADVIMRQMKISRNSYFATAWFDQGWGFRPDLTFIPLPASHGWAIYEGGTSGYISWTWPYKVF